MASKEVTDRSKAARSVAQAAETHGDAAASALEEVFAEHLPRGESLPEFRKVFSLFGSRLTAVSAALVRADDDHEKELGDDAEPRDRRDTAAATLYASATELRSLLDGAYGPKALAPLGVRGDTPHDPSALATWVDNLIRGLRDRSITLPAPRRKGIKLDREAEADALEAELTALQEALGDVSREKREAEATQTAKNKAMERYDETFAQTAGLFTVLFRAAGMLEVAERVKPSRQRPGRTADEDTEKGSSEGSADTNGAAGSSKGTKTR